MDSSRRGAQVEGLINRLHKEFKVVSTKRILSWKVWLVCGTVLGALIGIVYIANQDGQFSTTQAAMCPYKADGSTSPINSRGVGIGSISDGLYEEYVAVIRGGTSENKEVNAVIAKAKEDALADCESKREANIAAARKKCEPVEKNCKKSGSCQYVSWNGVRDCKEAQCSFNSKNPKGSIVCSSNSILGTLSCICGDATGRPSGSSGVPDEPAKPLPGTGSTKPPLRK